MLYSFFDCVREGSMMPWFNHQKHPLDIEKNTLFPIRTNDPSGKKVLAGELLAAIAIIRLRVRGVLMGVIG